MEQDGMAGSSDVQARPAASGARHDHGRCIDAALARAAALCARRGARLTSLRRRVLELVWQDHAAVKAYDLLKVLDREGGQTKPPTVYRALDFLIAHGLVHRLESLNAFIGCPAPEPSHSGQFLICGKCGDVVEFEAPEIAAALETEAAARHFTIVRRTIEVHGLCAVCTGAGHA